MSKRFVAVAPLALAVGVLVVLAAPAASADPLPQRTQPPDPIRYEAGDPVPPGYHVAERMRKGPMYTGAGMLGGGYALSLLGYATLTARNDDLEAAWPLTIPVAGPFMAMAVVDPRPGREALTYVSLASLGAIQLTGVALIAGGALARRKVLVKNSTPARWGVVPAAGPQAAGLAIFGTL